MFAPSITWCLSTWGSLSRPGPLLVVPADIHQNQQRLALSVPPVLNPPSVPRRQPWSVFSVFPQLAHLSRRVTGTAALRWHTRQCLLLQSTAGDQWWELCGCQTVLLNKAKCRPSTDQREGRTWDWARRALSSWLPSGLSLVGAGSSCTAAPPSPSSWGRWKSLCDIFGTCSYRALTPVPYNADPVA